VVTGRVLTPLEVVAGALRTWQREHGGDFVDEIEKPAQAVLDALADVGYLTAAAEEHNDVLCNETGCLCPCEACVDHE
jgi:hypothetical protein